MGETAIEDVYNHNLQQLSELQAGDMIEFKRGIYSHWAIYIGNTFTTYILFSKDVLKKCILMHLFIYVYVCLLIQSYLISVSLF